MCWLEGTYVLDSRCKVDQGNIMGVRSLDLCANDT